MNIRNGAEKKVLFSTRDELGDKIDKLTVLMGRLATNDSNDKRPFKPQIYKSRGSYLKVRTEATVRETIKIGVD